MILNRDEIEQAYLEGRPLISDAEYDLIYGNQKKPNYMLSMDAISGIETFKQYIKKFKNLRNDTEFIIEPKIDGVSVLLIYYEGKLSQVLSRGSRGDSMDILYRVRELKVNNIPEYISSHNEIKVRGEISISKENFLPFKNQYNSPRNLSAGSIFSINKQYENIMLDFIPFYYEGTNNATYLDDRNEMSQDFLSFPSIIDRINILEEAHSDKIFNYLDSIHQFEYELDGIVLKINNYTVREQMGDTNTVNKWQFALKPEGNFILAQVIGIEWNISRTSHIFPVLHVHSILSNIKRIYAYNVKYLQEKKLGVGSIIHFHMGGSVIPIIKEVLNESENMFEVIVACPDCREDLENEKCVNVECMAKITYRIKYGLLCLKIKSLGEKLIKKLVINGIKNIFDILNISHIKLIQILGKTIGTKIFQQIDRSIHSFSANQIMSSLGIPLLANNFWKKVAKYCKNIKEFIENYSHLSAISLGKMAHQKMMEYFNTESNIKELINISYIHNYEFIV